ncbi:MAG TPA: tRNA pseudouridine(13) synthase TruD [Candidatus Anammoximicrobium sp.]|nr:tRNA pseudouridine(13) synthase TruD [Candidatus Anammoximicrobium sp.]
MRLKRIPEDFQVEELTDLAPSGGPFALYRLTKRWIGTPEAVDEVLQCWRIERQRVSYGGLKDFHGVTQQHLTIQRGPRRDLHQARFDLTYQGQVPRPFQAGDVSGNRFLVILRDLDAAAAGRCQTVLSDLNSQGVPNYFDDQRFGSVGQSGQFIAEPWCRGDYERALWLALADPNEHDTPADVEEKAILRDDWGDWRTCQPRMSPPDRRRIVSFLADRPGDFRAAMARLPIDLRSLYAAAFQSHLWNRLLDRYLRTLCRPEQLGRLPLKLGPAVCPRELDPPQADALAACQLPLPSARLKPDPGPIRDLLDETLREFGIELRQIRIKYPRDTFFSKGYRPARFVPQELSHTLAADELYAQQQKLSLAFTLARGSYATLLVKCLQAEVEP